MFTSFIGVSSYYFVVRSRLKSDIIESTNSTAFLKLRSLLKIKQSWKNWRFLLWNMLIDMITIINVPYTVLYRLHALVWSWSGFLVTNLNKSCSFEWFTRWNKCGKFNETTCTLVGGLCFHILHVFSLRSAK